MKKNLTLLAILGLGLLLRFYHNLDISLWHDEAFSALLIKYPWQEMLYRIGLDVHPPAYYVILKLWHYVFSDSLLALRSLSVLFGVGTIWAVWLLVKVGFKDSRLALTSAFLVAINPFQIQYATEARMYTMGAFFTLLSCYFLVKAFLLQTEMQKLNVLQVPNLPETFSLRKKIWVNYFGFILATVVMVYTHYYLLFASMAIGFFGLVYLLTHHRYTFKNYALLLTAYFTILLAYVPWLNTFLYQLKQVGAGYWIPPMDKWSVPSTLYTLLLGFSYDISNFRVKLLLVIVTIIFLMVVYKFLSKTENFYKWLIFAVALAPFLGSILFYFLAKLKGSNSSVYLVRYFVFTSPFLIIILSAWLNQIKRQTIFKLSLGLYIGLCLMAFNRYWHNINIATKPGMAKAVKYLYANYQAPDKLYVGSSFMFFNLKYYLSQNSPVAFVATSANQTETIKPWLYSGGVTEVRAMPHYAGTALLTNNDLLPDLNRNLKSGNKVWLVWTNGFGAEKPKVPLAWQAISQQEFPEVRPYLGTSVFVSEYQVKE